MHSAITYPIQGTGKAANCSSSSTAWLHSPWLPEGAESPGRAGAAPARLPSPGLCTGQRGEAAPAAGPGRSVLSCPPACPVPLPVLSPSLAAPRDPLHSPGHPRTAGLWRMAPRPRSALPSGVSVLLPLPPPFHGFESILTLPSTPKFEIYSVAGNKDTWKYTIIQKGYTR